MARTLSSRWAYALAFLVVAAFLTATYSFRRITDTELNSFQTRALVQHGDVQIDRFPRVTRPGYFKLERGGHMYSIYGVGVSVVAAPIYAVATRLTRAESVLQAAGAIPFVAAAVVLMYLLLVRLARPPIAAAGAVLFGFGTPMWPLASMALYQHGPAAVLQIVGLLGFFSERRRASALAGLGFGAATFVRLPLAIPFAIVGLFYLVRSRKDALWYAVGAAVPIAGLLLQNRWIWGSWFEGGYSNSGIGFNANMRTALWGLLFGQWRGLFIYSPALIVGVIGIIMALRRLRQPLEARLAVLGISVVAIVLFYSTWTTWWNGLNQFGYRYLLDTVPFLIVLGAYAVARNERVQTLAVPLAVLSIMTMTWGAASNRFGWDGVMFPTRLSDTSLGQAWIVFVDRPWGGLLRLAGVAAIGLMFLQMGRLRRGGGAPPFGPAAERDGSGLVGRSVPVPGVLS